ncbi:hypothetical protein FH508_0015205 [Lysinibacillus sp. CD3-6]|uniref:hypothetical protein n=1 Tax=Lysinibacillus sp. CD3-6 TaxID=2892541 RepID=UPI0011715ED1|nr:hypothetical protein [Lysinibacillus sp. CD3-6]UED78799.1 hypothetical protein FH508_0015205 [Lysinibacillus sp. CD3-6]
MFAQCIPFDDNVRGRIGGNPPKLIEEQIPDDYRFYATLVHSEKEDVMLSIIIHKDFDTLLENNIYPSIEVRVIEHKYSEIGSNPDKSILDLGMNSISDYSENQGNNFLFIKVFGEPRLIQPKSYYFEELGNKNYSFFLQIEEEGYIDNMDYVFMYGALYLYKHNETGQVIAGFWQCS